MLKPEEVAQLAEAMRREPTASAALPFLRELAASKRIEDIPAAIQVASGSMEVNKGPGAHYLAQRTPALVVNYYWPATLQPADFNTLIEASINDRDWSKEIEKAVESGSGGELRSALERIERRLGIIPISFDTSKRS